MPAPSDTYGAEVWNDTPTAYWRLDGDTTDVMGGTSGTLVGSPSYATTLVSTYSGAQSLDLITNKYMSVPDAAQFDYTLNMSVEAWWRSDTMAGNGMFVSKYSWGIGHLSGTTPRFWTYDGATVTNCSGSALSNGVTYHIVGTYDGANMKLYINGSLAQTTAFTASFPVNTNAVLVGSWDTVENFVDGRVDEVAVYGRALTATEVADHYAAGTGAAAATSAPLRRRLNYGSLLQV